MDEHQAPLPDIVHDDKDDTTDAEYAAFRYACQRQQFRTGQHTTAPDAHLSDEAKARVAHGLSIEGMGFTAEPDEGIDTTRLDEMINEQVRQRGSERCAQAQQAAEGTSTTYAVSDALTGRLMGTVRRDGAVIHVLSGEISDGLLAFLERMLHKGGMALMETYMSVSALQAGYRVQRVDE